MELRGETRELQGQLLPLAAAPVPQFGTWGSWLPAIRSLCKEMLQDLQRTLSMKVTSVPQAFSLNMAGFPSGNVGSEELRTLGLCLVSQQSFILVLAPTAHLPLK